MNNLNNSVDEVVECPLCMEPLEVDDLNFFPCTCGYQICRFCWHRIRTDENELCPACRKEYPENPADFKPLTQEEMIAFKSQKRQRDQQRKQKITENRKHLANVRVVQKNLVFVVGLPPRLADADILKKHEYFGKYGKIHKVVINPSTTYAGIQGPSASAYVTYVHNTDALRAIQSVNNVMIDGRLIKTSLGTTKYCSHFMKNQQCPKGDCMYLHELGDSEASFTKEEMHQGKHQEYEKRLHDVLIASSTGYGITVGSTSTLSSNIKNSEGSKINGINSNATLPSSTSSSLFLTNNLPSTAVSCTPKNEAWPSLSISPVNRNDSSLSNSNKNKKERTKPDKNKIDKNCRSKNNKNNNTTLNPLPNEVDSHVTIENQSTDNDFLYEQSSKLKDDKRKERNQHSLVNRPNQKKELCMPTPADNERPFCNLSDPVTSASLNLDNDKDGYLSNKMRKDPNVTKIDKQRFLSFSNNSSSFVITPSENNSLVSESKCGQSSPGSFNETNANNERVKTPLKCKRSSTLTSELGYETESENAKTNLSEIISKSYVDELFRKNENMEHKMQKDSLNNNTAKSLYIKGHPDNNRYEVNYNKFVRKENKGNDYITDSMTSLNIFDENSIFSSRTAIPSAPLSFTHNEEIISNQLSCTAVPNLPDLINGIDGYQNTTNEWEEALKNVMNKTSKQMEDQGQQNLQERQQIPTQALVKHQEELQRLQELHKPNSILNSLTISQLNGAQTDSQNCSNNYVIGPDFCRQSNYRPFQQQSKESPNANGMQSSLFGTNMSKFFDFHKHQQQKLQTSLHISGQNNINGTGNENFHMMPTLENSTLNSQLMDQSCSLTSQQHHQKLKSFGKLDRVLCHSTLQQVSNPKIASVATQQNQYTESMGCDDDLGFDPFVETQKALAELIENDEEHNVGTASLKLINHKGVNNVHQPHQHHMVEYMQRSRMPPPGFNHVNNFSGYGVVPRIQNSPHIQHPNHLPISSNAWGAQLGNYQQHPNDQQVQANLNQTLGSGNPKGYTGSDWTAMDPAILSFRQFSFPQQAPQIQPQQQELYLQHVAQRSGFTSQPQHVIGVPNTVMNSQQSSQTHVNANVQGMLEYLKTRQFV